jgi:uncharacterized protein YecE (DUF72 family)
MAELRVGTSGYAYPAWRGVFYPPGLPEREMLAYYGTRFSTVEINYTFYRLPSERSIREWGGQVPAGFQFALKLSQKITHVRRLRDCEDLLERFLGALGPARERGQLGPILVQLPPSLRAELTTLDEFFRLAPPVFRFALEVRHTSWRTDEADAVLRGHGVALCLAETDEASVPDTVTADFVYVRLRREAYAREELAAWRRRCDAWVARGLDVYVYVKHDDAGTAPTYARALCGEPL